MMVGADGVLIIARNQTRAKGGANRGGRVGSGEAYAFGGQIIHRRCFDGGLSIARKVCRHVIDADPQNVWSCGMNLRTPKKRRTNEKNKGFHTC